MSVAKPGGDDGNCGYTNKDLMHRAICRVVDAGITVVAAAGNNQLQRDQPQARELQRGHHRLGARRHRRQARRPRRRAVLLVGLLRPGRHVRRLLELRRRRGPDRARQVHLVDRARQRLRLHLGHVDGGPPRHRRRRAVQGLPARRDAGPGQGGAARGRHATTGAPRPTPTRSTSRCWTSRTSSTSATSRSTPRPAPRAARWSAARARRSRCPLQCSAPRTSRTRSTSRSPPTRRCPPRSATTASCGQDATAARRWRSRSRRHAQRHLPAPGHGHATAARERRSTFPVTSTARPRPSAGRRSSSGRGGTLDDGARACVGTWAAASDPGGTIARYEARWRVDGELGHASARSASTTRAGQPADAARPHLLAPGPGPRRRRATGARGSRPATFEPDADPGHQPTRSITRGRWTRFSTSYAVGRQRRSTRRREGDRVVRPFTGRGIAWIALGVRGAGARRRSTSTACTSRPSTSAGPSTLHRSIAVHADLGDGRASTRLRIRVQGTKGRPRVDVDAFVIVP